MICTTVDYGKSVARRGLRFAGVDANIAQDLVNAAEIATYVAPVMSGAYVAATSTKIGVKTASAFRSAVHEISAATRFGLDVLEDYAQFKARGPQLVYARSRAFDRTFSAPKRAHSSIIFQERSSRFNSQGGHQSSKASAAPKAQEAPVAKVEQTHISANNGGFRQFDHKATEIADAIKNGKIHDYSKAYPGEVKNFISVKEFEGTLSKPLRVVSYHSDKPVGSGRTIKYWTPVREGNEMGTIEQVMDRLALLSEWGNRTHVSIAEIPAGEYVKFMHGRAIEKSYQSEIRLGGGVQYCFEKFNESWIKMTKEIPGVK
ncbi:MAG: hypothetical protein CNLJKLNK_01311 [Holosporales bacterium]